MVAPQRRKAKHNSQEYRLSPRKKKESRKRMSRCSLTTISEESSQEDLTQMEDENDFDGFDLEIENEGPVTPEKKKPERKIPQAPKKATKPSMPKADEVPSSTTTTTTAASTEEEPAQVGLPNKFDVLCGQSRICANHTGNRRFQVVLDIYASRYDAVKSKQEKMMLTKEIVGCIASSGGRFLKYKDGMWTEISSVTARDKVSHALRTKVQSWKRQQAEKLSPNAGKKNKRGSIRKRRPSRRRSAPSSLSPTLSEVRAVSFDGSDGSSASSNAIMDELLRSQREIFEQLTQDDMQEKAAKPTHPLKRTETWS